MAEAAQGWVTQREDGGLRFLRLMRWVALHVPDWIVSPLLWTIALWYAAQRRRPATAASAQYLARVLGRPARLGDRHRHALTFAHVILDRVRLLAGGVEGFRITSTNEHLIEDQHVSGRGAVLLSAHIGSFETLRAFDRTLPGLTVRYLMYPDHAQKSSAVLREVNPEIAARVIPLSSGPDAMLAVAEALDRGEFVGFLGDRVPDLSVKAHVGAQFLGGEIRIPTSPFIAAMLARVPVILCFAPRLGSGRYDIRFETLYDGAPVPRRERAARCAELAGRYAAAMEALCREHPDNWFNFFDIWGGELRGPAAGGS